MEGPRPCRPEELPGLYRLVDTVFRPGAESSMVDEFPTLFNEGNCEHLLVMLDEGRPVSSINYVIRPVVIYGNVLSVGSLGAVSTYEEYRGRGLATTLLEDTFSRMRREGADVVLISGQRGLYQRAGCAIGGHELTFTLDRQALDRIGHADGISLTDAADADIPALIAIHQTEPARYIRSPWDWQQFLKVCRLVVKGFDAPFGARRCWLVVQGSRPLAYVVSGFGRDRATPSAGIVEFGGSRRAVLAGLGLLADKFDLRAVGGRILPQDGEMQHLLEGLGAATEVRLLGGHRLAILGEGIFSRFQPWLRERVGPEFAGTFSVSQRADAWFLSAAGRTVGVADFEALNATLFGDAAHDLRGDSEAVALFRQALPLPWLLPGMNYI
jgi:predicted N-acetyltransferase YhbS